MSASYATMDAVHFKRGKQHKYKVKEQTQGQPKAKKAVQSRAEHKACPKCGKSPFHPAFQCPAKSAECHNCGKQGYYGKVCRSTSTVNKVAEDVDGLFLGEVASRKSAEKSSSSLL